MIRDFKKYTSKKLIKVIQEHPDPRPQTNQRSRLDAKPNEVVRRSKQLLKKFNFEAQKSGRATNYKLWKDGFHPVILDTLEKMEQRVNYIHYNPVEAEIVFHERDYVKSSYRNYEEENTVFCNVNVENLW